MAPPLLPWIKSHSQTALSIRGTTHTSCLLLSRRFLFSASLWNYSNKPITSSPKNWYSPHPLVTTAMSPTDPGCLLCSRGQPPHGPCLVQSPSPTDCECMWLINCYLSHLSSVRRHMFSHPHKSSVEIPPSTIGWRWGDQNNLLLCDFFIISSWFIGNFILGLC